MKLIVPEKGRVVTSTGLLKSGSLSRVVLVLVTGRQLRYEYGTRTRTAIRQPTTGDAVQFGAALVLVYS